MMNPTLIMLANGVRAPDGFFQYDDVSPDWFGFIQQPDIIFWRPATGEIAWELGLCFALGEEQIGTPASTAFGPLSLFATPLQWLQAERKGIFVVRWPWAFEWLRYVPRIALAPKVEPIYRRHMQ